MKSKATTEVRSGTIQVAAAAALGQVFTGLGLILVARNTLTSEFGRFAGDYALAIFAGGLFDFGSSQSISRQIAKTEDHGLLGYWLVRRTAVQCIMAGVLAILLYVFRPIPGDGPATLILGLQALTLPVSQSISGAVRAIRGAKLAAWQIAAGNLLFLAVCYGAPVKHELLVAALGATGSWLVTSMLGYASLQKMGSLFLIRCKTNPWAGASGFGIFALSTSVALLTVPLVEWFAGAQSGGELAAVSRWTQPIVLLTLSYSTFMFPRFSRASSKEAAIDLLRSSTPISALCTAAALTLIALSPLMIRISLGAKYLGSVNVLRFAALFAIPVIIGQPIATMLQAQNDERFVGRASLGSAALALLATSLLAVRLGAVGGPIGQGVGSIALLAALVRRVGPRGKLVARKRSPGALLP